MNVNNVSPTDRPKDAPKDVSRRDRAQQQEKQNSAGGDRVDISAEARTLAENAETQSADRKHKLEQARRLLESGKLYAREAFDKAAEELLRSGDIEEQDNP